jgi:flagellar assembly factor FliW
MVRGPLGFENEESFLILQYPDQYPLVYLQSIATPELCFLALPVLAVEREYSLHLTSEDASLIETGERPRIGADVLCLALITMHPDGPTANLLAPVVINLKSRAALQCISAEACWSHQYPLPAAEQGVAA